MLAAAHPWTWLNRLLLLDWFDSMEEQKYVRQTLSRFYTGDKANPTTEWLKVAVNVFI